MVITNDKDFERMKKGCVICGSTTKPLQRNIYNKFICNDCFKV